MTRYAWQVRKAHDLPRQICPQAGVPALPSQTEAEVSSPSVTCDAVQCDKAWQRHRAWTAFRHREARGRSKITCWSGRERRPRAAPEDPPPPLASISTAHPRRWRPGIESKRGPISDGVSQGLCWPSYSSYKVVRRTDLKDGYIMPHPADRGSVRHCERSRESSMKSRIFVNIRRTYKSKPWRRQ